jgi:hypothetical protein
MAIWDLPVQHEITVCRNYSVPKATLKGRIDWTNLNALRHKKLFERTADLPEEVEMIY